MCLWKFAVCSHLGGREEGPLCTELPPCLWACMLSHFSHVWLFVTPWTVAYQVPLSMDSPGKNTGSGLPCPPAEDLSDPGIKLGSPALQANSWPLSHRGSPRLPSPNLESVFSGLVSVSMSPAGCWPHVHSSVPRQKGHVTKRCCPLSSWFARIGALHNGLLS